VTCSRCCRQLRSAFYAIRVSVIWSCQWIQYRHQYLMTHSGNWWSVTYAGILYTLTVCARRTHSSHMTALLTMTCLTAGSAPSVVMPVCRRTLRYVTVRNNYWSEMELMLAIIAKKRLMLIYLTHALSLPGYHRSQTLVSTPLCLVLPSPSSSSWTWSPLSTFLSPYQWSGVET